MALRVGGRRAVSPPPRPRPGVLTQRRTSSSRYLIKRVGYIACSLSTLFPGPHGDLATTAVLARYFLAATRGLAGATSTTMVVGSRPGRWGVRYVIPSGTHPARATLNVQQ
eukprot:COSAG02_NODE_10784_length_1858_cov_6.703240_2_plen_111_part_00